MSQSHLCFYKKCNECAIIGIAGCSCQCHTTRVTSPYYKPISSYSMLRKLAKANDLVSGLDNDDDITRQQNGKLTRTRGRPPRLRGRSSPYDS